MYNKIIQSIEKIMDVVARYTLAVAFSVIFIIGLFIKAMYSFDDSPYFTTPTVFDFLSFAVVILITFIAYKYRDFIQKKTNYKLCFVLFTAAALAYVILVPLIPFSDMSAVYQGAILFAEGKWSDFFDMPYWNVFLVNMKLAMFWGVLIFPFPKQLITFKIYNIIMMYVVARFTGEIAKKYTAYYNLVYLGILSFLPFIIYSNHIYYDMPVIMLIVLGLYLYIRRDNLVMSLVVLSFAGVVRDTGVLVIATIVIVYVIDNRGIKGREAYHVFFRLAAAIALFITIKTGLQLVVEKFQQNEYQPYPSWNGYYIGINETEFGFMNNAELSYSRSLQDVIDRIREYGPIRICKILLKKTFWLWSQGTYQAQRYGFGIDTDNWNDKFQYQTVITPYVLNDSQFLRKVINAFGRAQYYVLFGLSIITLWRKSSADKYRLFIYMFMAMFLTMLIFELKSRYILFLFPCSLIMAIDCFDYQLPRRVN